MSRYPRIDILNTKSPMRTWYVISAPMEARTEWQRTASMEAVSMWNRLGRPSEYVTTRRGFRFKVYARPYKLSSPL